MFKNYRRFVSVFCVMAVLAAAMTFSCFASNAEGGYVLTYPDGSTVKAVTYEEAKALEKEWKLLYEGETDKDGKIDLKGWDNNGEIKIYEEVVPLGYTAETRETIVDLSEGEAKIVNVKTEVLAEYEEEDENSSEVKAKYSDSANSAEGARTGDDSSFVLWLVAAVASAIAATVIVVRRRGRRINPDANNFIRFIFVPILAFSIAFISAAGSMGVAFAESEVPESENVFTIKKVDQYNNPIEKVLFKVYGKPVIGIRVTVKKNWIYQGASTSASEIGPQNDALRNLLHTEDYVEDGIARKRFKGFSRGNLGDAKKDQYAFPYAFMADLKASVTVKNGLSTVEVLEGERTLSELLGADFRKGQYVEVGPTVPAGNPKTPKVGKPHFYYSGSAEETLGMIVLREGQEFTISEKFEGSLEGKEVYIPIGEAAGESIEIQALKGSVKSNGIGHYYNLGKQYNDDFNLPLTQDHLQFFKPEMCGETGGVLMRNIADKDMTISYKDGKLTLTREGEDSIDITDNAEVSIKNIVQWRSQAEEYCPPKWK